MTKNEYALVGAWGADIQGNNNPEAGDGGIKLYRVQPDGKLSLAGKTTPEINVGSISIPGNGDYVYATDERKDLGGVHGNGGGIASYRLDKEAGTITFLNEVSSAGAYPCYITADSQRRFVFAANHGNHEEVITRGMKASDGTYTAVRCFDEGSIAMFPVKEDGSLGACCDLQVLEGTSILPLFQWTAHPHSVCLDPTETYLLVGDKGCDLIRVFKIDYQNGLLLPVEAFDTQKGSGPRHIVFHPTLPVFYCNSEQNHTVHAYSFDGQNGHIAYINGATTVEEDYAPKDDPTDIFAHNQTADLRVHKTGNYLYVSNRGADSIAVYMIDHQGAITLQEIVSAEGAIPRAINFNQSGDRLYVVNQRSGRIVSFAVEETTGNLTPAEKSLSINNPVSLQFTN